MPTGVTAQVAVPSSNWPQLRPGVQDPRRPPDQHELEARFTRTCKDAIDFGRDSLPPRIQRIRTVARDATRNKPVAADCAGTCRVAAVTSSTDPRRSGPRSSGAPRCDAVRGGRAVQLCNMSHDRSCTAIIRRRRPEAGAHERQRRGAYECTEETRHRSTLRWHCSCEWGRPSSLPHTFPPRTTPARSLAGSWQSCSSPPRKRILRGRGKQRIRVRARCRPLAFAVHSLWVSTTYAGMDW